MTASDSAGRQGGRTTILTIALLAVATVGLGIACAAIGEEILTLPENRKELQEIAAHLRVLREERDSLIADIAHKKAKIAEQKIELSRLNTEADEARDIASRLPGLQAEEARARNERDRLVKQGRSLTSDRDVLQARVDLLTEQRQHLKDEVAGLERRVKDENQRLDQHRQEVDKARLDLARTRDELASVKKMLAEAKADLVGTDRQLQARRKEHERLVKEGADLTAAQDELQTTIDGLTAQKASLEGEIGALNINIQAASQRLDQHRQEVDKARTDLAQTRDELASERQMLAQSETDLAETNRLLQARQAELTALTVEEQSLRTQTTRLKKERDELDAGNRREAVRLASLQGEIDAARTGLEVDQRSLDLVRDDLVRVKARLEIRNVQAEALDARIQHLSGMEARVRQRIRAMIEDLSTAEGVTGGSETPP